MVAVEVKLSPTVDDGTITHLRWLHDRSGNPLADAALVSTRRTTARTASPSVLPRCSALIFWDRQCRAGN